MPNLQDFKLKPPLARALEAKGILEATPIQAQAIPLLLEGRDVLAQASTGTGKTLAYGLPLLDRIELGDRRQQALVLGPTRELCSQITQELRRAGTRLPGLRVLPLTGGEPIAGQQDALKDGAHVVVATPGRLVDHLHRGTINLQSLRMVVLDEGDRMLEMGFQEAIDTIMTQLPYDRQTTLFSATFPDRLERLAIHLLRNPVRLKVVEEAPPEIRQLAWDPTDPEAELLALIQRMNPAQTLIFCSFKASAADLADTLSRSLPTACLQGDLEQWQRDQELARFRSQSARILVATDVAARGLDISDLELVINYELPATPEIYTHRIGRTGRAGASGIAISRLGKNNTLHVLAGGPLPMVPRDIKPIREEPLPRWGLLKIIAGRRDKLRPGDILGALTGEAGKLTAAEVGKIEVQEQVSFVAVAEGSVHKALLGLQNGRIKTMKLRVLRID